MNDESSLLRSLTGVAPTLEGVTARGTVVGLHFELTVEQRYHNAGNDNIEAVYTFPLPYGAILLSLEFEIGGKRLEGRVVEKKAAQEEYEQALDKGDSAVLLERSAEGLYTVNVGNLLPGERAVVRYRYAQLLSFVKGQVRLAVPTVIAPRYGNAMAEGGLEAQQVPKTDLLAEYPFAIDIEIEGPLAEGAVGSPSHAIALRRTERGIRAFLTGKGYLDKDFVLSIQEIRSAATATLVRDGAGYVLHAAFCPAIAGEDAKVARVLKILVDCSGSMKGDSIAAAKRALHEILARLEPGDHFSLARFGSSFVPVNKKLVPVTDASIRSASEAVSKMDADLGGTEMAGALRAVLKQGSDEKADVLLITDGEVWNLDGVIEQAKSHSQRIYAVGIGAAPADSVLRHLAEQTGGANEFVTPTEDVSGAITRMFLRTGQPPATSVRLVVGAVTTWATPSPKAIYDGETIHLFAGLDQVPESDPILEFALADGSSRSQVASLSTISETSPLPRIAAWHRLPLVAAQERGALAERYGLVTDQTSLVLVHERAEGEKAIKLPQTQVIPQMLASGWGGIGVEKMLAFEMGNRPAVDACAFLAHSDGTNFDQFSESAQFSRRSVRSDSSLSARATSIDSDMSDILSHARDAKTHRLEDFLPRDFIAMLANQQWMWETLGNRSLPRSIRDLKKLGLPIDILDALRQLVHRGYNERVVVSAFLEVIGRSVDSGEAADSLKDSFDRLFGDREEGKDARQVVWKVFRGTTAAEWQVHW